MQDVKHLIELLGEAGASAGLESSYHTVSDLKGILVSAGHRIPLKARKKDIVSEIVSIATRRVDLPIEQLMSMSFDNLLKYFEDKRPNNSELLKLLGQLDFHPGSEARKSLYKYAARQIAETGMFQRVAESNGKG